MGMKLLTSVKHRKKRNPAVNSVYMFDQKVKHRQDFPYYLLVFQTLIVFLLLLRSANIAIDAAPGFRNRSVSRIGQLNNIHFSKEDEQHCDNQLPDRDASQWDDIVNFSDIIRLEKGLCGKGPNRLLVFTDGTKACARYRSNIDQIQGEIFSYYLSKLLHIKIVPQPRLTKVEANNHRWSRVRDSLSSVQWASGQPIVLTRWIENLTSAYVPGVYLNINGGIFPVTSSDRCELLQWSDLIVFDYLIGHLDRLINMFHNSKWDPHVFNKPVHNLLKSEELNSLIFLDNESGLLHGYRFIDQFAAYQDLLLKSVCVFRRATASAIEKLHKAGQIGFYLQSQFMKDEPNHKLIPLLPDSVTETLQKRLSIVYHHIKSCAGAKG